MNKFVVTRGTMSGLVSVTVANEAGTKSRNLTDKELEFLEVLLEDCGFGYVNQVDQAEIAEQLY